MSSPWRFNADPAAHDLMMGWFLPATKAMASDAPLNATRKSLPWAQEIPGHKKVFSNDIKMEFPLVYQSRPMVPLKNVLNGLGGESEDDDCDDNENSPARVCGLLPRFCLLNPVLDTKDVQLPGPHLGRGVRERSL